MSRKDSIEELIWTYRIFSQCSREEAESYILKLLHDDYLNTNRQQFNGRDIVLVVFSLPEEKISETIMSLKANSTDGNIRSRIHYVQSNDSQNVNGKALEIPNFLPFIMLDDLSDELRLLLMLDNIEQGD